MIARIWKGTVRSADGDVYAKYIRDSGSPAMPIRPATAGAWLLRREMGERTEFLTFTLWESLDAAKAFAGENYETAKYYPEDDRYLVERDLTCAHYEVDSGSSAGEAGGGIGSS